MLDNPVHLSLQPCPFCGASDVSIRSYQNGWRAGCDVCQALGPTQPTQQTAVISWNAAMSSPKSQPRPGYPSEFKEDELTAPVRSVGGQFYFDE